MTEQRANDIFSNKKAIIAGVLIAVLESIRNYPDKQKPKHKN